jgi:hypothetical protein
MMMMMMMMDQSWYGFDHGEVQEIEGTDPGRNTLTHLIKSTWLAVYHLDMLQV